MIPLDSPKWNQLDHAYGVAKDIPALIRQLESFPSQKDFQSEPYFSLWSALCHQGDVYSASYAAVPHIIGLIESGAGHVEADFFQLPTCIEIARFKGNGPAVDAELHDAYFDALAKIPKLVALVSEKGRDEPFCRILLSAIAVSSGHHALGEAIQEMEPEMIGKFMKSLFEE